jgi:phosphatidate phosphatase APP1
MAINGVYTRGLASRYGRGVDRHRLNKKYRRRENFCPSFNQIALVSDIDDTVLVSHSSTKLKKLQVLFTRTPRSRNAFAGIVELYQWLAHARTRPGTPNPFFYVSSSEWNLYDDLVDFFAFNQLPEGSFLLNQVKRWYELLRTGNTKHHGKLLRILRVIEAFPQQRFILLEIIHKVILEFTNLSRKNIRKKYWLFIFGA